MSCNCPKDWRLEILDLASGRVLGYLPFVSFTFDDLLNQVGPASITLNVRDAALRDIFPHLRAVAFTRVSGPNATPNSPVCEYIGIVESVAADSGGTLTIGLQSIEYYLNYRILHTTGAYVGDQSDLGSDVVNAMTSNGIQLGGASDGSGPTRTIDVEPTSDTRALDFIINLCAIEDGPDYVREHSKSGSSWSTVIRFVASAGDPGARPLSALSGVTGYGLNVDASQHTNWVRGRDQNQFAVALNDVADSIYPRFDKGVKYSDMIAQTPSPDNLDEAVAGEIANNADPIALPDITVADLDVAAGISLGDVRLLDMNHGALRYYGNVRVVGKSWSRNGDGPTLCTISAVPNDSIANPILDAPPSNKRGCC